MNRFDRESEIMGQRSEVVRLACLAAAHRFKGDGTVFLYQDDLDKAATALADAIRTPATCAECGQPVPCDTRKAYETRRDASL